MANVRLVLRTGPARAAQQDDAAAEEMMTALRAAASGTRMAVVRADGKADAVTLDLDKLAERATLYGGKFRWPTELGIRLADVPADGLAIEWPQFERNKALYYALLNARFKGLTMVDGDRVFEDVRLCPAELTQCVTRQ